MTRAESYDAGWHHGRRWAERDLANSGFVEGMMEELRVMSSESYGTYATDIGRANYLGIARGYRQAVADFESGRTSRETFDQAPLGKP